MEFTPECELYPRIIGVPSYLSTLLSEKITGYSRRYPMQLEEARCRLQITKRSFKISAASVWNKLPLSIRSAPSISIFRKRLKKHILL